MALPALDNEYTITIKIRDDDEDYFDKHNRVKELMDEDFMSVEAVTGWDDSNKHEITFIFRFETPPKTSQSTGQPSAESADDHGLETPPRSYQRNRGRSTDRLPPWHSKNLSPAGARQAALRSRNHLRHNHMEFDSHTRPPPRRSPSRSRSRSRSPSPTQSKPPSRPTTHRSDTDRKPNNAQPFRFNDEQGRPIERFHAIPMKSWLRNPPKISFRKQTQSTPLIDPMTE